MDKIIIKGQSKLKGSINIPGSKNATVLLKESVKRVRRKTLLERLDFKAKQIESAKGKKISS